MIRNIHLQYVRGVSRVVLLILLLFFLAACAFTPRGGIPVEAVEETLATATQELAELPAPPPPEVLSALFPAESASVTALDSVFDVERFDIAADEVPAKQFFTSLVEGSQTSMVVHPDVSGVISIDMKNTTLDQVLAVIHNVYGYPYQKNGSIYQVLPATIQARTFQVNYLNLVRQGHSQTWVSSGQITESQDNANDSDDGDSSQQGSKVALGSQVDTTSNTDFWTELRDAIQSLIGTEEGRKVIVQPQAGIVVVVAMPDELKMVEEYLQLIQANMQRQVVIEAKIIEVRLADGFQSGINWGGLSHGASGEKYLLGMTGGGSIFDGGVSESSGNAGSLVPGEDLPTSLAARAFGGVFSAALSFDDFQAFVELLETQGDVQVLSSPRISTVNNQKAVIKVGSDEYFVTNISSDTTTSTSTTTSTDIELTPFFSGIALDVTPQIGANGWITLHIHPTVSQVEDQKKIISALGAQQELPLAYSTIRETDSIVHARSGQLVVIGGLMQENATRDVAGVPFLDSIPGLGSLFRHTKAKTDKSELVILLRPKVIDKTQGWVKGLEKSTKRIEEMAPEMKKNWRFF